MFSRMGRLRRRWSLLSAMSLSLQNLPLSCQGPSDRFAVNGLVDRDRPGDGTLFPTECNSCVALYVFAHTQGGGQPDAASVSFLDLTLGLFDESTNARIFLRGCSSDGGVGFGGSSLRSVEVFTRQNFFSHFPARQWRQLAEHPSRGDCQKAKVTRLTLLHSHNPLVAAG